MKKFVLILLASFYILSVTGIGINQFYCCGKLESTNILLPFSEKQNDKSGSGCFKHEQNFYKVNDSHESTVTTSAIKTGFTNYNITNKTLTPFLSKRFLQSDSFNTNSPPLGAEIPIFLHDCVFLI